MIVWPLRPNWRDSYTVTYTFKTDIFTSRAGREQRRALRQTPRKSIEFLVTGWDTRFRTLGRTLAHQQGSLLWLPELTRAVSSSAASASGADTFTVASAPTWMTPQGKVVLSLDDRAEVRTIETINSGVITFEESNASGAWPAGTKLCPALSCRVAPSVSLQQVVKGIAEGRLRFDVDPGSEDATDPGAAAVTWNGREVFLEAANWARRQDLDFTRDLQVVDYGAGAIATYQPVAFGIQARSLDFLAGKATDVERLVAFFLRMKGRQGEFYLPSVEPDMVLAEAATGAAFSIKVQDAEVAAAYADDPVFTAISVTMTDGRQFYAGVSNLAASGSNTVLTLTSPLPYPIAPNTVQAISWLAVCRLASDELVVEWVTDQVAQVRMTYQTLEALPAE